MYDERELDGRVEECLSCDMACSFSWHTHPRSKALRWCNEYRHDGKTIKVSPHIVNQILDEMNSGKDYNKEEVVVVIKHDCNVYDTYDMYLCRADAIFMGYEATCKCKMMWVDTTRNRV